MMTAILITAALACGSERRDVKTLSDPLAGKVQRVAEPCSIEQLVLLQPPAWKNHGSRVLAERKRCKVRAEITAYKAEADNDIHVVIRSALGTTMISEFPHPDCAGRGHKAEFAAARRALLRLLPKKPGPRAVKLAKPVPVSISGVVFFDKIHGQLGVARNGVELHPATIETGP